MFLQLEWTKDRDPVTCAVSHFMYDPLAGKVATITKVPRYKGKQWQVQIKDRAPWHRKSLKIAKADCEWVYSETIRSK